MFSPSCNILTLVLMGLLSTTAQADEALQDPTRPDATQARRTLTAPVFNLSAILISDTRRVAILNGKAVKPGDRIDGATVSVIRADSVQLNFRGRLLETALSKGKIRQ